ncbi:hypothetical protein ACFQL7_28065 [Halocatena marina]|uniref:Uncharacterized protein n=1 Tax=Halocatena marina TaxID=2934937 RepID=A0ABD5YVB6_9EURY
MVTLRPGEDEPLIQWPYRLDGRDDVEHTDADRTMIHSYDKEDIDAPIITGKHVDRSPFDSPIEDNFRQQMLTEYVRTQTFSRR